MSTTTIDWDFLKSGSLFGVEKVSLEKQKSDSSVKTCYFKVNIEIGLLECFNLENKPEHNYLIDLTELQQIRTTEKCRESMRYLKYDFKNHIALLYGKCFMLNCLLLKAEDKVVSDKWCVELPKAVDFFKNSSYKSMLNRFLYKQYLPLKDNLENKSIELTIGKVCSWFEWKGYRFNPNNTLKNILDKYDPNFASSSINFKKFETIYHQVALNDLKNLAYSLFFSRSYDAASNMPNNSTIDRNRLIQWLVERQNTQPAQAPHIAEFILANYSDDNLVLTEEDFLFYLLSKDNTIVDTSLTSNVYQDMSQPMPHYWINSSHNTYLTGNQFMSDSSVECYIRAIQLGCRCIEIDVWDRLKTIVVTHGLTRCGQIDLKDVLYAVNAYAFEYSNQPFIISIENHCCLENQELMATYFRTIFGDKLITNLVNPNETIHPSPMDLTGRIILKNRKNTYKNGQYETKRPPLNKGSSETESLNEESNMDEFDVLDEDTKSYQKYVFKIENQQLFYWKVVAIENQSESENSYYGDEFYTKISRDDEALYYHYYDCIDFGDEPWLFDNITRNQSSNILGNYRDCYQDGTFLIRKSERNAGDFTLCVLLLSQIPTKSEIFYIPIKRIVKGSNIQYILDEKSKVTFESLSMLVSYYRKNTLRSSETKREFRLKVGVNKNTISINEDWFMPDKTRETGDRELFKYHYSGSFFIRGAENYNIRNEDGQVHAYTLAFYMNKQIYHAKIFVEISANYVLIYFINNKDFSSLKNIVEHYRGTPVFRKQKLTVSLNWLVNNCTPNKSQVKQLTSQPLYPNVKPNQSLASLNSATSSLLDLHQTINEASSDVKSVDINNVELKCEFNKETRKYDFIIAGKNKIQNFQTYGIYLCGYAENDAYDNVLKKLNSVEKTKNSGQNKVEIVVHANFSDLICYCVAVAFNIDAPIGHHYEISSFGEPYRKNSLKNMAKIFNNRHNHQLSRVYPKGLRIDSSNYDPVPLWSSGFQLVALNYQTPDIPMQINHARFTDNGGCGYVLKPKYLLNNQYDPLKEYMEGDKLKLNISPIFAHHLPKAVNDDKATNPALEIELISDYDLLNKAEKKVRTKTIKGNGLFPIWYSNNRIHISFAITNIEWAFLRFSVYESDLVGSDILIAQATYPVSCLRTGYRSVPLKNKYNQDLPLSVLFVNFSIEKIKD